MSKHLSAKQFLFRRFTVPITVGLLVAAALAMQGNWTMAGIMVAVSLGSLVTYPWTKRQLATRDAAAAAAAATETTSR